VTTARALEQALLALEERGAPFPSTVQPILARATAGLAHFVSRVKNRDGFTLATSARQPISASSSRRCAATRWPTCRSSIR
jgi:hypothetical protein